MPQPVTIKSLARACAMVKAMQARGVEWGEGRTGTGAALAEGRRGKNIRPHLLGLLRQAVYGRLAGYEDVNDAERLA